MHLIFGVLSHLSNNSSQLRKLLGVIWEGSLQGREEVSDVSTIATLSLAEVFPFPLHIAIADKFPDRNQTTLALRSSFMRATKRTMVPRDGIEPPTRGFSIPCSTN